MARINFEDSVLKDGRFIDLAIKMGSRRTALGALLEAYLVAQRYWVPSEKRIPTEVYGRERLATELIEVGLAEQTDDGVYIRGSKEQFAWLVQRSRAGSVKKPRTKSLGKKKSGTKRDETEVNGSERVETSLLSSPSSFLPSHSSELYSVGQNSFADVKSPVGFFIGKYVQAYQKRFGDERARPDLRGKAQGLIKNFLKETPLDRAVALIETYLTMNDQWFITKGYDFVTFNENVSKIALALDTGKRITQAEARGAESGDFYREQMRRLGGDGGLA
jgi:hypothetical protein